MGGGSEVGTEAEPAIGSQAPTPRPKSAEAPKRGRTARGTLPPPSRDGGDLADDAIDAQDFEASILSIAQKRFGIESFRPGQVLTIRNVLAGINTLAIMPTGAGKSLCYQLPAQKLPGITLVVSPLIALMKDQHDKLEELGIEVIRLDSTLTTREEARALKRMTTGEPCIAFVTPERLGDSRFRVRLAETTVGLFVVDEAHCISQWGHDFRPAYLGLSEAVVALGSPPVLALTATAPPRVKDDIIAQLGLKPNTTSIIDIGLQRPNLHYHVFKAQSEATKQSMLLSLLESQLSLHKGSGIIYAATVKTVDAIADFLKDEGVDCERYHGRLRARQRERAQTDFMVHGTPRVMVATNAFGLGVDKQDIRFVIHYNFPGSLESYYQEAGRAGRDGAPANCILLYQPADKRIQSFFLGGRYPTPEQTLSVAEALLSLYKQTSDVQPLKTIAERADAPTKKARVVLSFLKEVGFVRESAGSKFCPLTDTPPGIAELSRASQRYEQKRVQDHARLESMLRYSESHLCRTRLLLSYFGYHEAGALTCGNCDNCLEAEEQRQSSADRDAAASLGASRRAARASKRRDLEDSAASETSPDFGAPEQRADAHSRRRALLAQAVARKRARRNRTRALKIERAPDSAPSMSGLGRGDLVRHSKWGDGEVLGSTGDTVKAFFPSFGEKLLKARFLEKLIP